MRTSSVGNRLVKFHHRNGITPHARGQHEPVATSTPPTRSPRDPLTDGRDDFFGGLALVLAAALVCWLAWIAFSEVIDGVRPVQQDTQTQAVSR